MQFDGLWSCHYLPGPLVWSAESEFSSERSTTGWNSSLLSRNKSFLLPITCCLLSTNQYDTIIRKQLVVENFVAMPQLKNNKFGLIDSKLIFFIFWYLQLFTMWKPLVWLLRNAFVYVFHLYITSTAPGPGQEHTGFPSRESVLSFSQKPKCHTWNRSLTLFPSRSSSSRCSRILSWISSDTLLYAK